MNMANKIMVFKCCNLMTMDRKIELRSGRPELFLNIYMSEKTPNSMIWSQTYGGTITSEHAKQLRDALIEIYPVETKVAKLIVRKNGYQWYVEKVIKNYERQTIATFQTKEDADLFVQSKNKE